MNQHDVSDACIKSIGLIRNK